MADVDDLLARLAHGLARGAADGLPLPDRLCRAAVRTLGCDGGAITIAYTQVERVTLCATDDTARLLEEAQDVVGQGPGPDAFTHGRLRALRPARRRRPGPALAAARVGHPHRARPARRARAADGRGRGARHRGAHAPPARHRPRASTSTPRSSCRGSSRPRCSPTGRACRRPARDRGRNGPRCTRPPAWSSPSSGSPRPTRSPCCGPTPTRTTRASRSRAHAVIARILAFSAQPGSGDRVDMTRTSVSEVLAGPTRRWSEPDLDVTGAWPRLLNGVTGACPPTRPPSSSTSGRVARGARGDVAPGGRPRDATRPRSTRDPASTPCARRGGARGRASTRWSRAGP